MLISGIGLACCLLENFVLEHEPPFTLSEFRKPKTLEIAAQSSSLLVSSLVILSLVIRKNGFSKITSALSILDCLLSGGIFIFFMVMFQHDLMSEDEGSIWHWSVTISFIMLIFNAALKAASAGLILALLRLLK
ncbi:unnamed protein product [Oikopleura dioica]|nr:unnamed protein product [Oikopleura dioica]